MQKKTSCRLNFLVKNDHLPRQARDKQGENPTAEAVWWVVEQEPPFEGNISYAVAHVDAFEGGKHRGGAKCKGGWLGSKYPMIGAETAFLRRSSTEIDPF